MRTLIINELPELLFISLNEFIHRHRHQQPYYVQCRTKVCPIFLQITLSCACCGQHLPGNFLTSSAQMTFFRTLLPLFSLGMQAVTFTDKRLPCLRITCHDNAHFFFFISTRISFTHVSSLTNSAFFLSRDVTRILFSFHRLFRCHQSKFNSFRKW